MLEAHLRSQDYQITATELARAAGYSSYSAANLHYGMFARKVCEAIGFSPLVGNSGNQTFTYVLAKPLNLPNRDWQWTLHSVVVEALNALNESSERSGET